MRKIIMFIMYITIAIALISGCNEKRLEVIIHPGITKYSMAMSSVPGIPLKGELKPNNNGVKITYHWITKEGEFLDWNEVSGKITVLGKEVKNQGEKVYLSVDVLSKPKVSKFNVVLKVEDIKTSALMAETSIEIKEDKDGIYHMGGD